MGERVRDAAYWLAANGADAPDTAELILSVLDMPGDWGLVSIEEDGDDKLVVGLVNTLVLSGPEAVAQSTAMLHDLSAPGEGD